MKTERSFSRDLHLPLSLVFTVLAVFLLAFKLPSFPQNPGLPLIITTIYGIVIVYTSIVLSRKQWLIAPIIGIAAAFASVLYSTTSYPVDPCGSTLVSQGFPYPWIQSFGISWDGRCPAYYERQLFFFPGPMISYVWLITDATFYTLLVLAVLELVAAARRSQSALCGFHVLGGGRPPPTPPLTREAMKNWVMSRAVES